MSSCLGNRLLIAAAAILLCWPALARAQARNTGQIVGTVRDATGAVVPNAELVLIDTGTGTTHEAKSGPDGGFGCGSAVTACLGASPE